MSGLGLIVHGVTTAVLVAGLCCQSLLSGHAVSVEKESVAGGAAGTYSDVRVFYATDRNRTDAGGAQVQFGADRGDGLSQGVCRVSIPASHRAGQVESPSLWQLDLAPDPAKHVMVQETTSAEPAAFFAAIDEECRRRGQDNAFIYVHGYNATFDYVAKMTAQMTHDLAYDGVPVFFTWPSQGSMSGYTVDEQNVEWAQSDIRRFLADFFAHTTVPRIHLIGHSMGSRALTRAIASLVAEQPRLRDRIAQIILAAPDIDADVFRRDVAPVLTAVGRPVTLYASSEDLALVASKRVHGYARAGEAGSGLLVLEGIDTIDTTGIGVAGVGHSYFSDNPRMLGDLGELLRTGLAAGRREGLDVRERRTGRYWAFRP
jgi:esterase/lipase superfamily enzyme